jgi:preprotein translocase SecE subunit
MFGWLRDLVKLLSDLRVEWRKTRFPERNEVVAQMIAVIIGASVMAVCISAIDTMAVRLFLQQILVS